MSKNLLNNFSPKTVDTAKDATIKTINETREIIDFTNDWIPNFFKAIKLKEPNTYKNVVPQEEGVVTTMIEPTKILRIFKTCKTTDDADKLFREWVQEQLDKKTGLVTQFEYHRTEQDPMLWFNTTNKGINFRPGFNKTGGVTDTEKASPLLVGDDCVHVKIAGRTGAGKSVTLNDLLNTMMFEYAPWSLELWLADFKLVEMSRYGSKVPAPHVAVIAATEMMEFVVSAMYEMFIEMSDRQKFFTKLGVQKLADFYKKYKITLPQKLLMADEFQQMFELATPKQAMVIEKLIKMIAKLGRATGYHLAFASQSMSGTVSGDVMANFKLGIALPCNDDVSSTIIGNGEASKLKGKGKAIANEGSGTVIDNRHYAVPFLNADEDKDGNSAMFNNLIKMLNESNRVGFHREQKFFKDDYLRPLTDLDKVMPNLLKNVNQMKKSDVTIDDILVLGETGLYKSDEDLEYVYFRKADKQNLMLCTEDLMSKAYMLKLIATQWKYKENMYNVFLNCDPSIAKTYDITEEIKMNKICQKLLDLEGIEGELDKRRFLYDVNNLLNKNDYELMKLLLASGKIDMEDNPIFGSPEGYSSSVVEMVDDMIRLISSEIELVFEKDEPNQPNLDMEKTLNDIVKSLTTLIENDETGFYEYLKGDDDNEESIQNNLREIAEGILEIKDILEQYKSVYLEYCEDDSWNLDESKLPQYNVWVIGADKSEDLDADGNRNDMKFEDIMKICTNYKMRFILCASDLSNMSGIAKRCSHVIIKSESENNYKPYSMDKKSYDEQYFRYYNGYENVNNFKAGMEVIPNTEKLFKMYDVLFETEEPISILKGIEY